MPGEGPHGGSVGQLVLPGLLVGTAREDPPVGRDHHAVDFATEARDLPHLLSVRRVPDANLVVPTGGQHLRSIGREADAVHHLGVAGEGDQRVTRLGVEELRRLVAARRGQLGPVGRPGDIHHPVRVVFNQQFLGTGLDVEHPDRAIGTAGRQALAIGAERHGEDRVTGGHHVADQCPVGGIEELDFALLAGVPGGDRQQLAIGAEFDVVGPLGDVGHATDELAVSGVPQHHFMVPRAGHLRAIGGEGDAGDRNRHPVRLGGHGLRQLGGDGHQGSGLFHARVQPGSVLDPLPNRRDLFLRERVGVLGHGPIFNLGQQVRAVGVLRENRGSLFAPLHHAEEGVHVVPPLGRLGVVARQAALVEDGGDVLRERDELANRGERVFRGLEGGGRFIGDGDQGRLGRFDLGAGRGHHGVGLLRSLLRLGEVFLDRGEGGLGGLRGSDCVGGDLLCGGQFLGGRLGDRLGVGDPLGCVRDGGLGVLRRLVSITGDRVGGDLQQRDSLVGRSLLGRDFCGGGGVGGRLGDRGGGRGGRVGGGLGVGRGLQRGGGVGGRLLERLHLFSRLVRRGGFLLKRLVGGGHFRGQPNFIGLRLGQRLGRLFDLPLCVGNDLVGRLLFDEGGVGGLLGGLGGGGFRRVSLLRGQEGGGRGTGGGQQPHAGVAHQLQVHRVDLFPKEGSEQE